jgi:two-component system chemotaxis sensor kinase CheA
LRKGKLMSEREEKLKKMFRSDSRIMLATLSASIEELESGELNPERLDRAFRAAHSIKSEAGFLHLDEIAQTAHRLEDSLSGLRHDGGGAAGVALRHEFQSLSRRIEEYLAGERPTEAESAATSPSDRPETRILSDDAFGVLREAKQRSEELFRVILDLQSAPEMRYPRAFLVVNNLELSCAVVDMSPSLPEIEDSSASRLTLLVTTSAGERAIRKAVAVDEVDPVSITRLNYEEVLQPGRAAMPPDVPEVAEPTGPSLEEGTCEEIGLLADEISRRAGALGNLDLSVDESRTDARSLTSEIIRLCGVLRARVDWSSRIQLLEVFRELRSVAVRYAARQGKRIRFDVGGGGAIVFGPVADALTDAVLHLIRNSIDHGIETIADRAGAGKPPAGKIGVQVDQVGDRVRVIVRDDGLGIDEERVRQISHDHERQLVDILVSPGFTTRTKASAASGRGVGLDSVVHGVRDLLSGSLSIVNRHGHGVAVEISVPTRNRLTHVLVVHSPHGAAAIPTASVTAQVSLDSRRVKRDSFKVLYYEYGGTSVPILTVSGGTPDLDSLTDEMVGLVVRVGARDYMIAITSIVAEETVVRDYENAQRVFSKTVGREVPFLFPPTVIK